MLCFTVQYIITNELHSYFIILIHVIHHHTDKPVRLASVAVVAPVVVAALTTVALVVESASVRQGHCSAFTSFGAPAAADTAHSLHSLCRAARHARTHARTHRQAGSLMSSVEVKHCKQYIEEETGCFLVHHRKWNFNANVM
ncbi:hypothetical protein O3P69_012908 [Scylla paramamosain]|uniref:Uncharacterized protein n=1 Tax=Scylla paramamosain TaxID=85552 RepID=A0AAW0TRA6_SCYPA